MSYIQVFWCKHKGQKKFIRPWLILRFNYFNYVFTIFFCPNFFNEITKMSLNSFLIIKLKIYYYKTKITINNLIIKININEKRKEIKKWHIYTFCVTGQVN